MLQIKFQIEPLLIGVGPYHVCCVSNDVAWFYDTTVYQPSNVNSSSKTSSLGRRQYPGAVSSIKISTEYAAVLFEGKIMLHMVNI